ncbi:MAG: hypothetical protein LBQ83_02125 [Candidatus Margulisbacteria bacterium]|jgi:hypothetical protein|nr:hypothetical protein [Candidatus Margulisiibacteriota bacterium]
MNTLADIFGWVCILYGLSMAWLRVRSPGRLYKYAAMQKKYGKYGWIIHFVCYTVIPIIFGCVLLV